MPSPSIYRTPDGEAEMLSLYDRCWDDLGITTTHLTVGTRFGATHVVVTGPEDAPPLLVFHGGNMISPISFALFLPLTKHFRIYAPDTIGHPGRSAQTRVSPRDNSYGQWAADVTDGLGLKQVACIGPSYGAGILLRLAVHSPQRIAKAVLIVPSGIVSPPLLPMAFQIVLPMLLYRLAPSRERLIRVIRPMTPEIDERLLEVTGAVFRHVRIEPEMPRSVTREELAGFGAETMILAAGTDVFFPGLAVVRRAKQVIPNLVAAEILEGSAHMPSRKYHEHICERIREFLEEDRPTF